MQIGRSGTAKVQRVFIWDVPSFDPITVYFDDVGERTGRVNIVCFGESWTSYFNAIGSRTIEQFFCEVDTDYMVNALSRSRFLKQSKAHEKYLARIVDAIKQALKQESAPRE